MGQPIVMSQPDTPQVRMNYVLCDMSQPTLSFMQAEVYRRVARRVLEKLPSDVDPFKPR